MIRLPIFFLKIAPYLIVKYLDKASIEIFNIRNSKMIGGENFILRDVEEFSEGELLFDFINLLRLEV